MSLLKRLGLFFKEVKVLFKQIVLQNNKVANPINAAIEQRLVRSEQLGQLTEATRYKVDFQPKDATNTSFYFRQALLTSQHLKSTMDLSMAVQFKASLMEKKLEIEEGTIYFQSTGKKELALLSVIDYLNEVDELIKEISETKKEQSSADVSDSLRNKEHRLLTGVFGEPVSVTNNESVFEALEALTLSNIKIDDCFSREAYLKLHNLKKEFDSDTAYSLQKELMEKLQDIDSYKFPSSWLNGFRSTVAQLLKEVNMLIDDNFKSPLCEETDQAIIFSPEDVGVAFNKPTLDDSDSSSSSFDSD